LIPEQVAIPEEVFSDNEDILSCFFFQTVKITRPGLLRQ